MHSGFGISQQQCWAETAKSLLSARTKQKIGLISSRDSVKSSSLDSDSNVVNRQIITVLPFYGIIQNSAYSLAKIIKTQSLKLCILIEKSIKQ